MPLRLPIAEHAVPDRTAAVQEAVYGRRYLSPQSSWQRSGTIASRSRRSRARQPVALPPIGIQATSQPALARSIAGMRRSLATSNVRFAPGALPTRDKMPRLFPQLFPVVSGLALAVRTIFPWSRTAHPPYAAPRRYPSLHALRQANSSNAPTPRCAFWPKPCLLEHGIRHAFGVWNFNDKSGRGYRPCGRGENLQPCTASRACGTRHQRAPTEPSSC